MQSMPTGGSKKIEFTTKEGLQLAARLDLPVGTPHTFALFAHCFTCSKDSLAAFRIAKALTNFGMGVLRFDFTGLGGSEGDFSNTNFSSNVQDLLQAIEFLRRHFQAPSILIGHSLGGAAVLTVASQVPEAKAVVSIASPLDLQHLKNLIQENKISDNQDEATVNIAGRAFKVKKQFLQDLDHHHLVDKVKALTLPILFFHSVNDEVVNQDQGLSLFAAAAAIKNFISLEGNHLLTDKNEAQYVAKVLAAWVSRYIPFKEEIQSEEGTQVLVKESHIGRLTQEIITGRHILTADEPIKVGGNDLGPSPYDLLLGALGACTNMTLRLYADLKGIPVEEISVKLNHKKDYAKDCVECEKNGQAKLDFIDRKILLKGPLSEEQKEKLLSIANKCPVHRTLTEQLEIDTQLDSES